MSSTDRQLTGVPEPGSGELSDGAARADAAGKDRIRSGVGASEMADSRAAGQAAAAAAVGGLGAEPPALVMVYGSVRYELPELLAGVRDVTGDAPLVGATTSGAIHDGGLTRPGRGVAVLALSAGPYHFGVGSVVGLSRDSEAAGRALARSARRAAGDEPSPHSAILVLADGLRGDQQALVAGLYKVAGAAVPVIGGAAADDGLVERTLVFDGDRVLEDAAVAVWINAPWQLTVSVGHGWRPLGLPLLVTQVDGRAVQEIGGRPAVAVVREQLDDPRWGLRPGWLHGPGPQPAHAFGLLQPDGSLVVRSVYLDSAGELRTLVPVPLFTPVQVVGTTPADLLSVVSPVVIGAMAEREPTVLLAFSCLSRLELLLGDPSAEAVAVQRAASGATTFGFYTYGEFARTTGVAGYHNATLATIAL
ncbi:FIST C-terminal domain-containing protein [Natronosporangium hydrolyticum]|uniref:FIST C-terminal domain-containing protein n=1 Tax=Natronosporangium hydrolyticum TaxID=2811111 RepID=A0A895YGC5_9ACTN|nr:FIST N-terminal domain-containing protein [Natronosporangium hydrolyticum]QSB12738.1 FIST C-terminal domain-containing protein [Natronosporangium hydrolyticum]